MKMWQCTQCGSSVTKSLVESLRDPPGECVNCGNDDFEVTVVRGSVHSLVDRVV